MKRWRFSIFVGVLVCCAALLVLFSRERDVVISGLEWRPGGAGVRYWFYLENQIEESVEAHVLLIAQSKSEGHDGTKLTDFGRAKISAVLAPEEKRKIEGDMLLIRDWPAHLVLSPQITSMKPIQQPKQRRP